MKFDPSHEQIAFFDAIHKDRMYDGYEVKDFIELTWVAVFINECLVCVCQC